MEQPTSHPIDRSTKQFGKNTKAAMPQQTQQPYIVIDSKPQVGEGLLDIITELKEILKSSIKALTP